MFVCLQLCFLALSERILWKSRFHFPASEAFLTVWVACPNYNSNAASLSFCLLCSAGFMRELFVCVRPEKALTVLTRSFPQMYLSCSFCRQQPVTFLMGVCTFMRYEMRIANTPLFLWSNTFWQFTLNVIYSNNVSLEVNKINFKRWQQFHVPLLCGSLLVLASQ